MWWLSEVFSLVFSTLAFTSALIFLSVVVRCRACQTLSILLVANSCCAGLVATGAGTAQALSMLCNRCYHSHACVVQAYFSMIGCGAVFHSLCLQAFHRLVSNVCHTGTRHHRYSQSTQFCSLLVLLQWLFFTSSLLPAYKHIVFIPGSCLCQISFAELASFLIVCLCIYIIPLSIIIVVYLILWRYHSKRMSAAASHGVARRKNMRRERLMIKRIVCPLAILFVVGLPYVIFFVQAQWTRSPIPSAHRLAALAVSAGWLVVMVFNIVATDRVREHVIASLRCSRRQLRTVTAIQTAPRPITVL